MVRAVVARGANHTGYVRTPHPDGRQGDPNAAHRCREEVTVMPAGRSHSGATAVRHQGANGPFAWASLAFAREKGDIINERKPNREYRARAWRIRRRVRLAASI